jgi:hypothetical protein
MKQFRFINNITGWAVFLFALLVYSLTMERTVSFWDCGEYISAAVNLEVVHPPGSPLHAMIGSVVSLPTPPAADAAAINFLSAASSAFTVLFFYWSLTMLLLKMYERQGWPLDKPNLVALFGGAVVAGCAMTFLDSFWFSAVEGEVYALSALFTSLIVWSVLRWERQANEPRSGRWLVLIALLIGLGSGVHLLHLLALPAVALVYYYKKYDTVTTRGILGALIAGVVIVGLVLLGVLDFYVRIANAFELYFVNSMGLPFWSGFFTFVVLFFAGVILLLIYAIRNGKPGLQLAMMATIMTLIGVSSYAMVVIRANANPPINMNRPADPMLLHAYLKREQYGSRPLFYGPQFTASVVRTEESKDRYKRGLDANGKEKYIIAGSKVKYIFHDDDYLAGRVSPSRIDQINEENKHVLFPRMGSWQSGEHAAAYRYWLGLEQDDLPSYFDNIRFFVRYQLGYMYWRYFMWNFSGRQDDVQGHPRDNLSYGNWLTGFDFIDKNRVEGFEIRESKISRARNKFYMIPFALGFIGLFFHFKYDRKGAWVIMILFFYTGFMNIVNMNEPPFEPRERDYAHALSFLTFAMWIGFAATAIFRQLVKRSKGTLPFALASAGVTALAPLLMGTQGWDDHDRSKKQMARATAIAYLESCEPNAVLFTQGDNDTYPLWYLQETEHIRDDIRVVNLSLLAVDWYIDLLRNKINTADAVKLSFDEASIRGELRTQIIVDDNPDYLRQYGTDLETALNFVREGPSHVNYNLPYLPTRRLTIPVDVDKVKQSGVVSEGDSILSRIEFSLPSGKRYLIKDELMILDIIASHDWDRPIYFARTVTSDKTLGLQPYLRPEGLAMRLVPVKDVEPDADISYRHIMKRWNWGNVDKEDFHLEETALRTAVMLRSTMVRELVEPLVTESSRLRAAAAMDTARGAALTSEADRKKATALRVLDTSLIVFPERSVPLVEPTEAYNYARLYYQLGEKDRGFDMAQTAMTLIQEDMRTLARDKSIADQRALSGNDVLIAWLQREPNRNKWPSAIRFLEQDMNMAASLIEMTQKYSDTAQTYALSQSYTTFEQEIGLVNPYMRSVLRDVP